MERFSFCLYLFLFRVFLAVSFCTIAFCFATSFCDIAFLLVAPWCIFVSLLSCLWLLVACGFHHFHLCGFIIVKSFRWVSLSLLVAVLFCCLFCSCFISSLSRVFRNEVFVSLWLLWFLARFLLALHQCSLKLLLKSFFTCDLIVSFFISIIALQSFKRGAHSLLASSSFWILFFVDDK